VRKDSGFGRVRPVHVRMALQGIGGRGYGLVGEAILERFGLSYMFKTETDAGLTGTHRIAADVRRRLRHWLAMSLPVENIAVRA